MSDTTQDHDAAAHGDHVAADQYHDGNERDIESKQSQPVEQSEAITQDSSIDEGAVRVLPGTGGPDDVGDSELAPEDYNRTGKQ